MKSKKRLNTDGTTRLIMLENNGIYSAFTQKEAVQAINELKAQLWSGLPIENKWKKQG